MTATAASASVRDGVASLVGARSGAAADSGDGGTFIVTATKTGGGEASEDAWVIKNGDETAPGGGTYVFRSKDEVDPAVEVPAGNADRDGEEVVPAGPSQEPPEETPVAEKTVTKKAKKGQTEEPVAE